MFVDVCERFKHFKNKNFFQVLIFSFSIKKIQNVSASSDRHHQLLILLILRFYSFCLFVFFSDSCKILSTTMRYLFTILGFWGIYLWSCVIFDNICFPLFYSVLYNSFSICSPMFLSFIIFNTKNLKQYYFFNTRCVILMGKLKQLA